MRGVSASVQRTLGSILHHRRVVDARTPAFIRLVPKDGSHALSWSMDKLGPICGPWKTARWFWDTIYGPTARTDGTARGIQWDANLDWRKLRVGYLKNGIRTQTGRATTNGEGKAARNSRRTEEARRAEKAAKAARVRAEIRQKYNDAALTTAEKWA